MQMISTIYIAGANSVLASSIIEKVHQHFPMIGLARKANNDPRLKAFIQTDILDYENLKSSVKPAIAKDSLNVVICGIGAFPQREYLHNTTPQIFERTFNSNILSFINLLRLFTPFMVGKGGLFFTFGSISGPYKYPYLGLYNAAKEALKYAAKTASHELSILGIKFIHINLSTIRDPKEHQFTTVQSEEEFLDCDKIANQILSLIKHTDHDTNFMELDIFAPNINYYSNSYNSRVPIMPILNFDE